MNRDRTRWREMGEGEGKREMRGNGELRGERWGEAEMNRVRDKKGGPEIEGDRARWGKERETEKWGEREMGKGRDKQTEGGGERWEEGRTERQGEAEMNRD